MATTNINAAAVGATQTTRNKYRYTASFQLVIDNESTELDPMYIKSIVIDYDYKKNTMPLIYLTVSIDDRIIKKLVQSKDTAVIIFNIKRFVANSEIPAESIVKVDYIKDTFTYFLPDTLSNYSVTEPSQDLDDVTGQNFTTTTLGLLSLDLVNKNKKTMNGVVNKTPIMSLVYNLLSDRKLIFEQFKYNKILNGIIIPPLESKAKMIKYLNSLNCFYDTSYRYFMDFDVTYLISTSGNKIQRKGEKISEVILKINKYTENDQKIEGMDIDETNKVYRIYVGDQDCEKLDNKLIDRSYSTIVAQGTSPNTTTKTDLNVSDKSVISKKRTTIRVPNDNTTLLKNMKADMDNSMVTITVTKSDLDMSIFTINKAFYIEASETYGSEYSGKYLLVRKRELYIREDEDFSASVMLTFNKIADSKVAVK
jgi:hypothetical protein